MRTNGQFICQKMDKAGNNTILSFYGGLPASAFSNQTIEQNQLNEWKKLENVNRK